MTTSTTTDPPAVDHPAARSRPGRVPAIDGLRGLALLGMLAWHAEIGWVKGGFARMTIFFALSGYLAAASFLALRQRQGERPFRTFWWRRARRLLPVSLLGVAFAVAVTVALGGPGLASMRGDAASVLAHASNWRFIADGQSYGDLFEQPSAFQHFWSLSLEEQCFWALPLVLAGAAALARRRAWVVAAAAGALLAAIPLVVSHSPDAAYYGTHVRAGEFLAGVALALHHHGGVPDRLRPAVRWLGTGGLVVLVAVMLTVDRSLPWLYQGGLGLFAIPAVAVVAAALDRRGPVAHALSVRPLVLVGCWAFPIYVLHWPLFLVLTPDRVGLSGAALVVVRLAAAIALGALVHHHLERPLLDAGRAPSPATGLAAGGGAPSGPAWSRGWGRDRVAGAVLAGATVALLAAVVAVPAPAPTYDFAGDQERANRWTGDADGRGAGLGLFGGSTAVVLGAALWDWSPTSTSVRAVPGSSHLGCGLLTEGERVFSRGDPVGNEPVHAPPDEACLGWDERWPAAVDQNGVELAMVMAGVWDTSDWRLPGDDRWLSIADPEVEATVLDEMGRAVDLLAERGAHVVLATTPLVGGGESGTARADRGLGDDHEERVGRYNALVHLVSEARPLVSVVDYGSFIDGLGPDESSAWLPDGIHPTPEAAVRIWFDFLGPQLEGVATAWLASRDEPSPPAEPTA